MNIEDLTMKSNNHQTRAEPSEQGTLKPLTMFGQNSIAENKTPPKIENMHPSNQGRSFRDFDEKIRILKKENFNLKLRIFFLEERLQIGSNNLMTNINTKGSDDDNFQQNIDLKVEIEDLRKELKDKQDLLCQAAKAMEIMEDTQRKQQMKSIVIQECTQQMESTNDFPSHSCENHDDSQNEHFSVKRETDEKSWIIQDLEEKLKAKTRAHEKACKTIQLLLIKTRDSDIAIQKLKSETISNVGKTVDIGSLEAEINRGRVWRDHCTEVCSQLIIRLKGLAGFLDSLLKQRSILDTLADNQYKEIRHAIDDSLDYSGSIFNEYSMVEANSILDKFNEKSLSGETKHTMSCSNFSECVGMLNFQMDKIAVYKNVRPLTELSTDKIGEFDLANENCNFKSQITTEMTENNIALLNHENTFQRHNFQKFDAIHTSPKHLKIIEENLLDKYNIIVAELAEQKIKNNNLLLEINALNTKILKASETPSTELLKKKTEVIPNEMADGLVFETNKQNNYENIFQNYHIYERQLAEKESLLDEIRENESQLKIQISLKESLYQSIKKNLDEVTLQMSKAVLERTKFMNERDLCEASNRELKTKVENLLAESSELHTKLAKLGHANAQLHNKISLHETHNDESDNIKSENMFSNLIDENLTEQSNFYISDNEIDIETVQSPCFSERNGISPRSPCNERDKLRNMTSEDGENESNETCNEKFTLLQKENTELKRKLDITRHAFEKTWTQLRTANQRKEQIEKDIRQEIYKTHNVLKNVRSNFQNVNIETNLRND